MTDLDQRMDMATDPVCGMAVIPEDARAKGLNSTYEGREYFFCGKGCFLEFADDPDKYLDADYVPHM
ncbi:MAG TPA: YHS domain-containing protein [Candidatus Limnocylindria bacterium]|nr:YHS domain-containing protein [Candidatus Limnocylindria bacterium]